MQQVMGMGKAQAADSPLATGRLLTYADVGAGLKGRQAEVRSCHCVTKLCALAAWHTCDQVLAVCCHGWQGNLPGSVLLGCLDPRSASEAALCFKLHATIGAMTHHVLHAISD